MQQTQPSQARAACTGLHELCAWRAGPSLGDFISGDVEDSGDGYSVRAPNWKVCFRLIRLIGGGSSSSAFDADEMYRVSPRISQVSCDGMFVVELCSWGYRPS